MSLVTNISQSFSHNVAAKTSRHGFGANFKCSFPKKNKAGFLKSFNSIFGKIGRSASEEVLFELIKSKCLPILLYGTDVCPMNSADRHSLGLQFTKKQDSV